MMFYTTAIFFGICLVKGCLLLVLLFVPCYLYAMAVTAPTISPNGGTIIGSVTVSLGTTTSGAIIYYTLDGTTPTTGSRRYTSPFVIASNTVVKAIATKSKATSSVSQASFFIAMLRTILLTWKDNADNEHGAFIERRVSTGEYSAVALVGTDVETYDDSVMPGNDYCWRVRAYNSLDIASSNETCLFVP